MLRERPVRAAAISVVGAACEKTTLNKCIEHGDARRAIDGPQAFRLVAGQLQPRHFQVFALDPAEKRFERFTGDERAPRQSVGQQG